MKKLLSFYWNRKNILSVGFIVLFATVGVIILFASHAATPYAAIEAETGATGGATSVSDSKASGNSYLQFGTESSSGGGGSLAISVDASTGQFVNQNGTPIVLHGVDVSGTEDQCPGSMSFVPLNSATANAIATWPTGSSVNPAGGTHINVVRVPLAENCWLGTANGGSGTYNGATYRADIVSWVNALNADGIYAILDMHDEYSGASSETTQTPWAYAAPDSSSGAFWLSVAQTFASNKAVIFDLLNEPGLGSYSSLSQANWTCWLAGCANGASGNTAGYATTGMQTLVNDVRQYSDQPIELTGNSYAGGPCLGPDSNCGIFENWPTDSTHQLALDVHQYGFDSSEGGNTVCPNSASGAGSGGCWPAFLSAADNTTTYPDKPYKVPVTIGELGDNPDSGVDNGFYENFVNWADAQTPEVGYIFWAWETGGGNEELPASYTAPAGCSGSVNGGNGSPGCWLQAHLGKVTTTQ